jgi:hypothetical protein
MNKRQARKSREHKLAEEVAFLKAGIDHLKIEHAKEVLQQRIALTKEIGYWKIQFDALDKEKDQWSEDARRLQDRIDTHEQLQNNEKFLGLVRAVKYINDFKIPLNA